MYIHICLLFDGGELVAASEGCRLPAKAGGCKQGPWAATSPVGGWWLRWWLRWWLVAGGPCLQLAAAAGSRQPSPL